MAKGLLKLLRNSQKIGRALQALAKPARALKKPAQKVAATAPRSAGDWISGVALGPAGARRYRLFKPSGLGRAERLPLLVMLHGCGQDAAAFALSTRMNRLAQRQRFLVLYPEQDRSANLQGCWNWFDTDNQRAYREAATLIAAVDQVSTLYPVDAEQIAVAGLSAGASMAALLASRYPARFAAVAMHSGIPPGTAHSTISALRAMRGQRSTKAAAADSHWPPLLVIHGAQDRTVAPGNGEAAALLWAEAGHAIGTAPRIIQRGARHAMTVTDFKHKSRVVATLCLVDGLGHAWSGGAAKLAFSDAQGPDASALVWAFASKQFKQKRTAA